MWLPKHRIARAKARKRRRLEAMADTSLWCQMCGTWENLELDHLLPRKAARCKARLVPEHNRMVLCRKCNAMKGDMFPSEVIKHLGRLGAEVAQARFIEGLKKR